MRPAGASFPAWVDDAGHIRFADASAFRAHLRAHHAGQDVAITVASKAVSRSLRANAYYHGVVLQAAVDETGNAKSVIHAFWCSQFLPDVREELAFVNKLTGQRLKVTVDVRRTSQLTGRPFYDFVEACRLWLQEWLGVTTPDPDVEYWRKRPKAAAPKETHT